LCTTSAIARLRGTKRRVLPGFGLSLGFTLTYLGFIVLIPLAVLFAQAAGAGGARFLSELTNPRTLAAFGVSFETAFLAAAVNVVFGLLIAWVLVRYPFPGRRFVDALIDLPFGLPTAVAGISLTTLYSSTGWIGAPLASLHIHVAFTRLGILVALVFVGLPFVVRTVEPVLRDFDRELEDAAALLGASRAHILARVILPPLVPALLTGFTLAFARAIGEYGSVIYRRQHAGPYRNPAAAHHHQARTIRLCRRHRHCRPHAHRIFPASAGDQPLAGLDAEAAGWLTRSH
jgi:sulfate transport system permease protein